MTTWGEFAAAAPEIAADGQRLFYRTRIGEAFLATVRDDAPPRLHPIYVAILEGRLVAFLLASPKATDLVEDGRYALHAHQDPESPSEFVVRGRAHAIDDPDVWARFAAAWYFDLDHDHRLFEFEIEHAIHGGRPNRQAWPPIYRSWRAGRVGAPTT